MKKTIYYTNNYSVMDQDMQKSLFDKYKKIDTTSFDKLLSSNSSALTKKYAPNGIVKPKGCSCESSCCTNNCCGRSKIENYLTCFFKNYSIITYEPAKIDTTKFDTDYDINFNNVEFNLYDSLYAIPRLTLPFALTIAYKTTGAYTTGGLTIEILFNKLVGSNTVSNVIHTNLPASSTLKFYTILLPCLQHPAAYGNNIQINFKTTDDVQLSLTESEDDLNRQVYCSILYHVLSPLNTFAVRSLANSTLFYLRFKEQLVTNLLPSPGIYGGVFRIIDYMFGIMLALTNGAAANALNDISGVNTQQLQELTVKLKEYLGQLKQFMINTSYMNANMIDDLDDYIINTGSNQMLDLYILTAQSYVDTLSSIISQF